MDTEELRPSGDTGPDEEMEPEEIAVKPFTRAEQSRRSAGRKKGRRYIETVEPADEVSPTHATGIFEDAATASVQSNLHQQQQQGEISQTETSNGSGG